MNEKTSNHPTFGHGKICYLQIPAVDIPTSATFYEKVFGWKIRTRSDGSVAFDDGVGEVSGAWVLDKPPMREPGIILYIMVDDATAVSRTIVAHGGEIVLPIRANAPEIAALFRDPAGNVLGIYQLPTDRK